MEKETKSLILPLSHLYYLTQDPNNETGFTIEEIQKLVEENGWDYKIEANITTPVCVPLTKEEELQIQQNQLSEVTASLNALESNPPSSGPNKPNKRSKRPLNYEDELENLRKTIQKLTSDIEILKNSQ